MEESRIVDVQDMLRARDERAARQQTMLQRHASPLISFTMNIAGSVKYDAEIHRAFEDGAEHIRVHLDKMGIPVLEEVQTIAFTGCEALWAVRADAALLKKQMCAIEESCLLGRLFDIDVIAADGSHLTRTQERSCLICGGPVRACARSRAHTAEALFARAKEIIHGHFQQRHIQWIAQCAQRALLYEALTTPKPGLVDCHNSGAHQDMDLFSFADSACVLGAYFETCAQLGARNADVEQLRHAGIMAEESMMYAAKANTHKGAIFSLGILCYAAASCGEGAALDAILHKAAELGQCFLRQLTEGTQSCTGGEYQFRQYGLTGARGEAEAGFPTVREVGLPALERALASGKTLPEAGLDALLHLMAQVQDSNVIRRAGMEGQAWVMARAGEVLANGYTPEDLMALDRQFIQRNISPGGSADLLAATYFLHFITQAEAACGEEQ